MLCTWSRTARGGCKMHETVRITRATLLDRLAPLQCCPPGHHSRAACRAGPRTGQNRYEEDSRTTLKPALGPALVVPKLQWLWRHAIVGDGVRERRLCLAPRIYSSAGGNNTIILRPPDILSSQFTRTEPLCVHNSSGTWSSTQCFLAETL